MFLCGAFASQEEFHGFPIIQDLYFVCRNFQLDCFDMSIHIADKSDAEAGQKYYMK